jgi:hypothetical protein
LLESGFILPAAQAAAESHPALVQMVYPVKDLLHLAVTWQVILLQGLRTLQILS